MQPGVQLRRGVGPGARRHSDHADVFGNQNGSDAAEDDAGDDFTAQWLQFMANADTLGPGLFDPEGDSSSDEVGDVIVDSDGKKQVVKSSSKKKERTFGTTKKVFGKTVAITADAARRAEAAAKVAPDDDPSLTDPALKKVLEAVEKDHVDAVPQAVPKEPEQRPVAIVPEVPVERTEKIITIPAKLIGIIVGRNGEAIQTLREQTKSSIDIGPEGGALQTVIINGDVRLAEQLIFEKLAMKVPHLFPTLPGAPGNLPPPAPLTNGREAPGGVAGGWACKCGNFSYSHRYSCKKCGALKPPPLGYDF